VTAAPVLLPGRADQSVLLPGRADQIILRAGRDDDAAGFIALLTECWLEYPGCVVDIDGEVPELHALASYFAEQNGALWVAEQAGRVVGMIATRPLGDHVWELCKVYAYASQRGTGLAQRLMHLAETHARSQGGIEMKLWSDTRFDRAHRYYEKHGYIREGAIRVLNDLSNSLEFGYAKPLTGIVIRQLDAAAAASAIPALQSLAESQPVWRKAASDVALASRILLLAWVDGEPAGLANLHLAAPHRAELQTLHVAPAFRRRGVARALLHHAQSVGHALLTSQSPDTDAARATLHAAGWTAAGRIPNFLRAPDGTPVAMLIFYREAR